MAPKNGSLGSFALFISDYLMRIAVIHMQCKSILIGAHGQFKLGFWVAEYFSIAGNEFNQIRISSSVTTRKKRADEDFNTPFHS